MQIGLKRLDGVILTELREFSTEFVLDGSKKCLIASFESEFQLIDKGTTETKDIPVRRSQTSENHLVFLQFHIQNPEVFPSVEGENLVGFDTVDPGMKLEIEREFRDLLGVFRVQFLEHLVALLARGDIPRFIELGDERVPEAGARRNLGSDDFDRAFDDFFSGIFREKFLWNCEWVLFYRIRYDLESFLDRDHRLGFLLGFVRFVELLDLLQSLCGDYIRQKLRGHLSEFLDPVYGCLFGFVEVLLLGLEFYDGTDIRLVEIAGAFLSVSCDKRHCRPFGSEFENDRDLVLSVIERLGNDFGVVGGGKDCCWFGHGWSS
ncbi:MAG: hypothetical protein ACD_78C00091G0007 [uncultured bacterium (gcode 4)]|uniref:Uncharacterized protein n=1 Tax=uncultured bacterium (gcode 4) TaxID=1234023 RepID=K1XIX6_9BACT|nr:MAG: hypothetical protein ACD_78C00091G0007 [uncultured bacterium (gcode 4)]